MSDERESRERFKREREKRERRERERIKNRKDTVRREAWGGGDEAGPPPLSEVRSGVVAAHYLPDESTTHMSASVCSK